MFALLREQGIAARLDENIGVDFMNMNRTSRALEVRFSDLPTESDADEDLSFSPQLARPTEIWEDE